MALSDSCNLLFLKVEGKLNAGNDSAIYQRTTFAFIVSNTYHFH